MVIIGVGGERYKVNSKFIIEEDKPLLFKKHMKVFEDIRKGKYAKGGKLNTDKIIKATDEILDADITNLDLGPKGISEKLAKKGVIKNHKLTETANFLSKEMKKQGFYAKGGKVYMVKDMDEFDDWYDWISDNYEPWEYDEVHYEGAGVYISDEIYNDESIDTLNRDNLYLEEDDAYAKGGVLDSDEKQEIDDLIDIDIHKYNEYDDLGVKPPTYDEYADSVIEFEITDKSKRDAVLEYIKSTLGKRDEYIKYWQEEDYAKGGDLDKEFKFDSNFIIYVPSTSDVSSQISKDELNSRVEEVKEFVSNHFGGYTETQADGGYKSDSGDVVEEDVVKVSVFAKEKDWENRENLIVAQVKEWANKWGQEAIGFEYEDANGKRKLYYIDREGKKGFGGFLFGTAVGGYAGYKYGLTKDKRDRADLFRTEQKYYGRAKSKYQDYKDRKRKGGPDIVDVDYEEFAKGGKVGIYRSDDMPKFLDKIFDKDFIESVQIQTDQMDINFKNWSFFIGQKDIKAVEKKGWTFDSISTYGDSGVSLLFTRKSFAKGGNLPVDVKVYSNDKGIYTVVDADSVFEMTDDFKGKYIGELTDFPSDITHWGKMIDIKEMSKPMQMGISQLKKI